MVQPVVTCAQNKFHLSSLNRLPRTYIPFLKAGDVSFQMHSFCMPRRLWFGGKMPKLQKGKKAYVKIAGKPERVGWNKCYFLKALDIADIFYYGQQR